MRLERLHVRRLPGLIGPFVLEPGPGVNVLLGPNAVGKSSVARAVRGLFWPDRSGTAGHELTARFADGLEAERNGDATVTWRRAGEVVPAPSVPAGHLADCYRLGAPDLLVRAAGATDRQLARDLRREMTGGVDLDGLAAELAPPAKAEATRLANRLAAASRTAQEVGRRHAELDARRAGLAELRRRLDAAVEARRQVEELRRAGALADARSELAEATAACEPFPPAMARVREEDADDFAAWSRLLADRKARIRDLVRRQEEIQRRLTALALPPDEDREELVTRLDVRVRACGEAARELARADESAAAARRAWAEARASLAGVEPPPDGDALPGEAEFADLVARHRAALTRSARRDALERLAGEFAPGNLPSRTWPAVVLAAGALVAAAPAVPGVVSGPSGLLAAGVGLLLVAGGATALVKAHRRHALADRARALGREDETRATVPQDSPWSLGRSLDEGGWLLDLQRLREAERCRTAARAAEAAAAQAAEVMTARLAACGETVAPWGLAPPASAVAAEEMLAEVRRRCDGRRRLVEQRDDLRAAQEDAMRERDEHGNRLAGLLARLGLPAGTADVAPVRELVDRLPAWRAADGAREKARLKVAALAADAPPELPADPVESAIRLAEAEERAAAEPELREEVSTLRERIRAARTGHARAAALAAEARHRDDLVAWRDRARTRAVVAALLEELREEHDQLITPPQLERARELFAAFTRNRHGLTVAASDDGPVLRARDHESGAWLELGELSGGTRAQLLLAVRLAFLEAAEDGPPPPLFLDESLTTADGERLAAIIGSLGLLARATGRQVFYLTSNRADLGAWTAALAAEGLPGPKVLDLAAARGAATGATEAELAPRDDLALPDPAAHDLASYGAAVGARRLDPHEPWRAADTIHLAGDDVALVHALRERGLARAGTLAAALAEDPALLPDRRARLLAALDVLRVFVAAWRTGRPRPATVRDVDESGAVSTPMRPGVLALLNDHGGRAADFMAALRGGGVKRFRADKMDALEEHLTTAGCLDDRDALDADGLVHAVQTSVRTSPGEVRTLVLRLHAAATVTERASTRPSGSDPTGSRDPGDAPGGSAASASTPR